MAHMLPIVEPLGQREERGACHARAARADDTDQAAICVLHDSLLAVQPSPVVEPNRAVAISRASGPAVALPLVQTLMSQPQPAQQKTRRSAHSSALAKEPS